MCEAHWHAEDQISEWWMEVGWDLWFFFITSLWETRSDGWPRSHSSRANFPQCCQGTHCECWLCGVECVLCVCLSQCLCHNAMFSLNVNVYGNRNPTFLIFPLLVFILYNISSVNQHSKHTKVLVCSYRYRKLISSQSFIILKSVNFMTVGMTESKMVLRIKK